MPSAATMMAAAQASKKAFIVFHLAGLAERESNMMPGYVWYKDADRHDGSSLTGPYVFFATGRHGDTIQSALQEGRTCRARRPMSASGWWSQPVDATLYLEEEMEGGLMAHKFHT